MEQNFETSFIPKKPVIAERVRVPQPIGIFAVLSIFVFFTILLASGGLYFYKGILTKNIVSMENDLNLAKNRFEPEKIAQLQVLDKRLRAGNQVLSKHIAISPIFEILEEVTMKTVRFTRFGYVFDELTSKVEVDMSGMAIGYRSIALQSDIFSQHPQMIDPVFTNLSLDDRGNVLFDLSFSVDPTFVNYKDVLKAQAEAGTEENFMEEELFTLPPEEVPVLPPVSTP